jgi:Lipocalin-like domain
MIESIDVDARRLHSLSRKGLLNLAASFGVLAAVGNVPSKATAAEGIVGAWSLVSFNVDEPGGRSQPRFGPDPVGYLIYSADSRMSAVLAGTHRPTMTSPSGTSSSEHARTEALQNFLAYAGRYEVRGDHVFHHVEVSVFTNLIGTTLERRFALEGDRLTIRTLPPEIWGSSNVLVWKRA